MNTTGIKKDFAVKGLFLLLAFLAIAMGLPSSAYSLEASPVPRQTGANDIKEQLQGYMEQGGYSFGSNVRIGIKDDPNSPPGWSNHVSVVGVIVLNFGSLRPLIGPNLPLDHPDLLGFLLFVLTHEYAHINCCHKEDKNQPADDYDCDELAAQINGTIAACGLVAALHAQATAGGEPLSDEMAQLLHRLCDKIASARNALNDPENQAAAADCATGGTGGGGGNNPCKCTAASWQPPKSDPCSDCPGFPLPGNDPLNPYPNGLIPRCDICDHI